MGSVVFTRWFFIFALTLAGVAGFFWRDIAEQSSDDLHHAFFDADQPVEVSSDDVARYLVRTAPAQSKPDAPLGVSDIRLESRSAGKVIASARLKLSPATGTYPHLIIELSEAAGRKGRSLDLSPSEYEHGIGLADERVRFKFDPRPGEEHLVVRAAYPNPKVTVEKAAE